jgi:opacity protein-like surface antigen
LLAYGTVGLAYGRVRSAVSIVQLNDDNVNFEAPTLDPLAVSAGGAARTHAGLTAGGGMDVRAELEREGRVSLL